MGAIHQIQIKGVDLEALYNQGSKEKDNQNLYDNSMFDKFRDHLEEED
jgi:hypothetical protein